MLVIFWIIRTLVFKNISCTLSKKELLPAFVQVKLIQSSSSVQLSPAATRAAYNRNRKKNNYCKINFLLINKAKNATKIAQILMKDF